MKILINTPSYKKKNYGGVANHIWGLAPYWKIKTIYNTVGKRNSKIGTGKYWILWDVLKFIIKIIFHRPDFVWVNPSIALNALKRDFIFVKIACFFRVKVCIFIHGFDLMNFNSLNKNWLAKNLNKASFILVLANEFKSKLENIGVKVPIELTTTKVEDNLIDEFNVNSRDGKSGNLLFLARVEKSKGIHETLDIFKILKKEYDNLKLQIVGDGSELSIIKSRVKNEKIPDVIISGRLSGKDLKQSYKNALLLLLTTHGEGMPTTVLEGMAFGLPIITRPVGGLADFFENKKMGFISESLDPKEFADGIRLLLNNPEEIKKISKYNYNYAINNFMASKVTISLQNLFQKYQH